MFTIFLMFANIESSPFIFLAMYDNFYINNYRYCLFIIKSSFAWHDQGSPVLPKRCEFLLLWQNKRIKDYYGLYYLNKVNIRSLVQLKITHSGCNNGAVLFL